MTKYRLRLSAAPAIVGVALLVSGCHPDVLGLAMTSALPAASFASTPGYETSREDRSDRTICMAATYKDPDGKWHWEPDGHQLADVSEARKRGYNLDRCVKLIAG